MVVLVGLATVGLIVAGVVALVGDDVAKEVVDGGRPPTAMPGDLPDIPGGETPVDGELVSEVPFDDLRIDGSGRWLVIDFVGARPGEGPCSAHYGAEVDERPDQVVVRLGAVDDDGPELSEGEACTSEGYIRTLVLPLSEPLAGRPVVDGVSGVTHQG